MTGNEQGHGRYGGVRLQYIVHLYTLLYIRYGCCRGGACYQQHEMEPFLCILEMNCLTLIANGHW